MSALASEIPSRTASAMREEGLDRLKSQLRRELGPVICAALDEPITTEIIVNSDGAIWVERFGRGMEKEEASLTPAQAMRVMTTTAALLKTVVNAQQPIVEGLLPLDGSRFAGSVPPISLNASFNIRKKPARIFTLEEYVAHGTLTPAQMAAIHQAIDAKRNILVAGGTGSGKTTLLNAILDAVAQRAPLERVVMIQDTDEVQCKAANVESFISTRDFDMGYLLRHTMRRSPLRIVVGEVRGAEAHVLVKAWGTGHPGGASTVHADSAEDGMTRIEDLIEEDPGKRAKPWAIAKAINVVVYIEKESDGLRRRIVKSVLKVSGYDRQHSKYLFEVMLLLIHSEKIMKYLSTLFNLHVNLRLKFNATQCWCGLWCLCYCGLALADSSSGMPWDGPLCGLATSLRGPAALAISTIAFFAAGASFLWGEEIAGMSKKLVTIVMGISILLGSAAFVGWIAAKMGALSAACT